MVVSDIHMGSSLSKTQLFCKFLDRLLAKPPRRLILNGDIFEMWNANYKNMGTFEYRAIEKVLLLTEKGTSIVYIPGNHDRAFRGFRKITLGKIKIRNEYVVKTHHHKYLVIHGDEFDSFTSHHIILALILDQFYVFLIKFTAFFKRLFRINLSLATKKNSSRYASMVEKIKSAAIRYARYRKMDGIVIGHTHWPEAFRRADGLSYANTGDWLDSCSYVVIDGGVTLHAFDPKD